MSLGKYRSKDTLSYGFLVRVGNFFGAARTNLEVVGSRLLPAGVPRGLLRMRDRARAFFADAPIFFISVVLGVALFFRVTIGAVRPSESSTSEPVEIASATEAPGRPASAAAAPTSSAAGGTGRHGVDEPRSGSAAAPAPPPTSTTVTGTLPRRKPREPRMTREPRAHGKR